MINAFILMQKKAPKTMQSQILPVAIPKSCTRIKNDSLIMNKFVKSYEHIKLRIKDLVQCGLQFHNYCKYNENSMKGSE